MKQKIHPRHASILDDSVLKMLSKNAEPKMYISSSNTNKITAGTFLSLRDMYLTLSSVNSTLCDTTEYFKKDLSAEITYKIYMMFDDGAVSYDGKMMLGKSKDFEFSKIISSQIDDCLYNDLVHYIDKHLDISRQHAEIISGYETSVEEALTYKFSNSEVTNMLDFLDYSLANCDTLREELNVNMHTLQVLKNKDNRMI